DIDAVAHRQRRHVRKHMIPFGIARHAEALAPFLRDGQAEAPIAEFERRIPLMVVVVVIMLGGVREWRTQPILALARIPGDERPHEPGGLEYDPAVAVERRTVGVR